MEKRNHHPETVCIQGGWNPGNGEPRVLPIYQSTTFKYSSSEQMGRLFDLEEDGYFYTRAGGRRGCHADLLWPGCQLLCCF